MLIEQTQEKLSRLKLVGMKHALEMQLNQRDTYQGLSFEERLGMLVDEECLTRENKRYNRLIKNAKLRYTQACIKAIDYHHDRNLPREKIAHLFNSEWVRDCANLIFTGPTGCGKTFMACALAHQACSQGYSVRYLRMPRVFEELRIAHADGSYLGFLKKLQKADVLLCDDWGIETLTQGERSDLLEIIEDRHGRGSTIITSQLPVTHWHEYVGDATIADAIIDRVLYRSQQFHLKGESLRQKEQLPDQESLDEAGQPGVDK